MPLLDCNRILSTRFWWRPPANGVSSHAARISRATSDGNQASAERKNIRVIVLTAVARGSSIIA